VSVDVISMTVGGVSTCVLWWLVC